jgi:predicted ArsR family transcriptional regulator
MLYLIGDYDPELERELKGWIEDVQYRIESAREPARSPVEKILAALETRSMPARQISDATRISLSQVKRLLERLAKEKRVGSKQTTLDPLRPGRPERFYFLLK